VGSNAFLNIEDIKHEIRRECGFDVGSQVLFAEGERVLVLTIPRRPRGRAYSYKGAFLMRSGSSLVPVNFDRLASIQSEGEVEWALRIIASSLGASDVLDLLDYKTFVSFSGLPDIDNSSEKLQQLTQRKLIRRDAAGYEITNMAAILLAKNLDDFPSISRKAARLVVYNSEGKLDPKIEIEGKKGYAAGIQGLMRTCLQHIPQNEVVRDALRQVVPLFPVKPLRELVVNAFVHQDFALTGAGPMVEVFPNRIEVSNPGNPIIPVNRFIDGHRSRNESLAVVMRFLKLCEERSSGVDSVIGAAELYQLPAPEFIVGYNDLTAIVHGHRDFRLMTPDDRIRACFQHCALRFVLRQQMTNESLRARFGLADDKADSVSKIISATVDAGLIKVDPTSGGSRRFARYLPAWAVSLSALDSSSS
jgi:ATP-dependent DNA helicase RecG